MDEQQPDGLAGFFRFFARLAALAYLCFAVFVLLPLRPAYARPVTLHAVDADVRAVLASVAELGGVGLVLDDSVQGTITIHLDEVEPEEAFAMIAAADDLSLGETGGVAIITASRTGVQGLYRPYVFPVRYADLDTVAHAVALSLMPYDNDSGNDRARRVRETDRTRLETENGSEIRTVTRESRGSGRDDDLRILADPATGSIVLYGTASEAKAAEKLIAALDRPQPQVSLEAKVIAIDKNAAKELGVEWEWSRVPQYPDYTTEYETRRRTVQNPDGSYTTVTEDVPHETVRRHWDGSGSSIPGIIRFGRGPGGYPFEFYYGAKINALITDGKANLLARPNITTLQGREAVINIGGEVPVQTVSVTNSTTTTSVTYREAGIILRCTPRVGVDGDITAKVHTEVSSPLYVPDLAAYRFNKRSADTEVRLRDGETMVIGGLIGSEESKTLSKIPFLGDLPILGVFFRNVRTSKTDSEVMIFLTAKIVEDINN
ncbi:MAG: type II secretion system protein GspD [Schwartzia sp.]|nr:type II secretion system protein GspD [Schwartzia sp. (in: firmicutes)]